MSEFHFMRPWMLLAFIPLAIALSALLFKSRENHQWSKVCDPHLLKHLLMNISGKSRYLSLFLITLTGIAIVLALAGPTYKKIPIPSFSKEEATVIALDVSKAMLAQDIRPSRLQRAKYKIHDILNKIKEGRVGLVVFTEEPFLVSPLTKDNETLKLLLPEIHSNIMPVGGSNIQGGLELAKEVIKRGGYQKGHIILITANKAKTNDIDYAAQLKKEGIEVSVLAMSTALGAPAVDDQGRDFISKLDKVSLTKLAKAGGGALALFTGNDNDLKRLLAYTDSAFKDYSKDDETVVKWKDEGRYLLFFIIPIVLFAFRQGWLESVR